jgi:hypothetical protein
MMVMRLSASMTPSSQKGPPLRSGPRISACIASPLKSLSSAWEMNVDLPPSRRERPHGEASVLDCFELDQFTLILRSFALSAFGKVSMTTPSLSSALMWSWSMSLESWKLRA